MLSAMPKTNAFAVSFAGATALTTVIYSALQASGEFHSRAWSRVRLTTTSRGIMFLPVSFSYTITSPKPMSFDPLVVNDQELQGGTVRTCA